MAKQPKTQQRSHTATERTLTEARPPLHLDLAAEALLDGWTREQVITALIVRIKRDQGYLAYRKDCNRRTSYDTQVQSDMRALALAACWLEEQALESGSSFPPDQPAAQSSPQT